MNEWTDSSGDINYGVFRIGRYFYAFANNRKGELCSEVSRTMRQANKRVNATKEILSNIEEN